MADPHITGTPPSGHDTGDPTSYDHVSHDSHGHEIFKAYMVVAVVKSLLVALYFMHLKYDWRKVGFFIVPALILGAMWYFVFMPDIVLAWH